MKEFWKYCLSAKAVHNCSLGVLWGVSLLGASVLLGSIDSGYALDRVDPIDSVQKGALFDRLITAQVTITGCRRVPCSEVARILELSKTSARGDVGQKVAGERTPAADTTVFQSAEVLEMGEVGLNNLVVDHPWIERLETRWKMAWVSDSPLSVEVVVRERKPAFVIEMRGDSWLVSADGFPILPLSAVLDTDLILEAGDLPRVSFAAGGEQAFGSSIEKRYAKALTGIRSIDQAGGLPFIADRYEVLADGSLKIAPLEVEFPSISLFARSSVDVRADLQKVNAVLKDLKSKHEKAENIDLRFANQAVVNYGRGGQVPSVVDTN